MPMVFSVQCVKSRERCLSAYPSPLLSHSTDLTPVILYFIRALVNTDYTLINKLQQAKVFHRASSVPIL